VNKALAFASILTIAAFAPAGPAFAQILDGSFEQQAPAEIGANPGYCYGGTTCTGVDNPWEAASGGGYQKEDNVAWPGTETPAGEYYAFIQNGGSVNQQFTATDSGTFVIDFLAAGRPPRDGCCTGNALYEVLLDGNVIFSDATTTGQLFTARTTNPFELISGNLYSLSFHGIPNGPDNTAYIDDVRLTAAAVPEPSTWAMLLLGFGAVGLTVRRRKAVVGPRQLA